MEAKGGDSTTLFRIRPNGGAAAACDVPVAKSGDAGGGSAEPKEAVRHAKAAGAMNFALLAAMAATCRATCSRWNPNELEQRKCRVKDGAPHERSAYDLEEGRKEERISVMREMLRKGQHANKFRPSGKGGKGGFRGCKAA